MDTNEDGKGINITEDQHKIPRFYIKTFANSKGFLYVLNRQTGKIEKPRPYGSVCYEKFYYAQQTGIYDKPSQIIEQFFGLIENDFAKRTSIVTKRIINNEVLEDDNLHAMARFMAMLWVRGDYMRTQIQRSVKSIMTQEMAILTDHNSFPGYIKQKFKENRKTISDAEINTIREFAARKEWCPEIDNTVHLEMISNLDKWAYYFYKKYWRIYIARAKKLFITSDTPVIEWFPKTGYWGANILERRHYFVLNPEILIELVPPISGKKVKRKRIYDDQVFDFNRERANLSAEYCYANREDELLDLAEYRAAIEAALFRK